MKPSRPNKWLSGVCTLFALSFAFAFTERPDLLSETKHPALTEAESFTANACSSPFADANEDWLLRVDFQFAVALKASDDSVRSKALQDLIITVKQCGDLIRWPESTLELLNVYGFDGVENNRIMAVAALIAIGDEEAIRRMRVLSEQVVQSDRVFQYTQLALHTYYKVRQQ